MWDEVLAAGPDSHPERCTKQPDLPVYKMASRELQMSSL